MTPRNYLSWSQYDLFGRSPALYRKRYFEDEEYHNKRMAFGKKFARMREGLELGGEWDHIAIALPDYPRREYEMTATVIIDGKQVQLLGIFDGCDLRKNIIADDKTGVKWTQAMADKTEQLTFYAFIYWQSKGVIPKLRIHWIQTEVESGGDVVATGKVETFTTTRTIKDFVVLQSKINKVWIGIVSLTEQEWNKVV